MEQYLLFRERQEGKDIRTSDRGKVGRGGVRGQSHPEKLHFPVPKPFYPPGLNPRHRRGPCALSQARAAPEPTQGGSGWDPACPRQRNRNHSSSIAESEGSPVSTGQVGN